LGWLVFWQSDAHVLDVVLAESVLPRVDRSARYRDGLCEASKCPIDNPCVGDLGFGVVRDLVYADPLGAIRNGDNEKNV
jgi:hypothetical protein